MPVVGRPTYEGRPPRPSREGGTSSGSLEGRRGPKVGTPAGASGDEAKPAGARHGLGAVSADFHATGSGQGSDELVAQGAVAPPGDGGLGGEAGFAQHGSVGASFESDGDGVAVVDDGARG